MPDGRVPLWSVLGQFIPGPRPRWTISAVRWPPSGASAKDWSHCSWRLLQLQQDDADYHHDFGAAARAQRAWNPEAIAQKARRALRINPAARLNAAGGACGY
jgi:hypothetical protein